MRSYPYPLQSPDLRGPLSPRFPVPACDAATAAANQASFDALEASTGRNNHYGVGDAGPLHLGAEWAWGLAASPRIVGAIQQLLGGPGTSVFCIGSHAFCKYGAGEGATEGGTGQDGQTLGPGAFVGYHQDLNYWGLDPGQVISAWTAIDDADVENGCMKA